MSAMPRSRPPGASTSVRFQAYRTDDPGLGKYLMQQLIDSLKQAIPDGLEEIQTLARTLISRSQDVLAYFDHPRTSNGPTPGHQRTPGALDCQVFFGQCLFSCFRLPSSGPGNRVRPR